MTILGLEVEEARSLFLLVDDGDGQISLTEFPIDKKTESMRSSCARMFEGKGEMQVGYSIR